MINISIVSYINSLPYQESLENSGFIKENARLIYSNPAECAHDIKTGKADIGLVPVAALPTLKDCRIISNFCLAAKAEVDSVLLLSEYPLSEIDTVLLDYQSRTSVNLFKILAKNKWKRDFIFVDSKEGYENSIKGKTAGVVIGDRALKMKSRFKYSVDLAYEWKKFTGLPMVFAVWVANKKVTSVFENNFGRVLEKGIRELDETISRYKSDYKDFSLSDYLNKRISYRYDSEEKESVKRYLEFLNSM